MIRLTDQLCTQTILTEDRLRLQSITIKIDGEQYRQLMELYKEAVSDAMFQDVPPEEHPNIKDILTAALFRGLDKMYKER